MTSWPNSCPLALVTRVDLCLLRTRLVAAAPQDDEGELEDDFVIPAPLLKTNEPGVVYVAFKKSTEDAFPITTFTNALKFTSKEIDPTTGEPEDSGYDDEYEIEGVELSGADYVVPAFAGNFDHIWEGTGANGEEVSETLALSNMKNLTGKFALHRSRVSTNRSRCCGTIGCNFVSSTIGGY